MSTTNSVPRPEIAIIGGGVVGLSMVMGLLHRNVPVKLYEQTSSFTNIGAGIGLTPNAVRALRLLSPDALLAQQKITTPNGDSENPNDWLTYVDGFNCDQNEEKLLFKLHTGYRGFEGCVRADFIDSLVQMIPPGILHMRKRLKEIIDRGDDEKILLLFEDGTYEEVDAVIGCDGIKSQVRRIMFEKTNPAVVEPGYNKQYALRGLIPMDRAVAALGEYKARNRHMHLGPGSHVITVPVALGKMVNLVAFIPDENPWLDSSKLTIPAEKEEILQAFSHFGGPVRGIIQALVDTAPALNKWAIFDSHDNPVPTYAKDRVCIVGDAAHPSSPHHGAGTGMGLEDSLALCTVLVEALSSVERGEVSQPAAIKAAWKAYSQVRRERTQWLVESSRAIGAVLEWRYPETMDDFEKCLKEVTWRSHTVWDYDQEQMMKESIAEFERELGDLLLRNGSTTAAAPVTYGVRLQNVAEDSDKSAKVGTGRIADSEARTNGNVVETFQIGQQYSTVDEAKINNTASKDAVPVVQETLKGHDNLIDNKATGSVTLAVAEVRN